MNTWKTTVTEVVDIFQRALVALLPAMEAAHIPWKDGAAYDDWDEITQAIYRNVVARSIWSAHADIGELGMLLPPYNMRLDSYGGRSVLLVSGPKIDGTAVFVGLSTSHAPFDTVDCVRVDGSENAVGTTVRQPFCDAKFSFADGIVTTGRRITDLSIEL